MVEKKCVCEKKQQRQIFPVGNNLFLKKKKEKNLAVTEF